LIQEAISAVLIRSEDWEQHLAGSGGLVERVERHASKVLTLMRDNEALVRGALLLSLQQWAKVQAGEELGEPPIQRGGRLGGILAALSPFQKELGPAVVRRLAIAISIFTGVESRIVMRDIWKLDEDEIGQVTAWIARTLARAAAEKPASRSTLRR
jgi:hypothetical protein